MAPIPCANMSFEWWLALLFVWVISALVAGMIAAGENAAALRSLRLLSFSLGRSVPVSLSSQPTEQLRTCSFNDFKTTPLVALPRAVNASFVRVAELTTTFQL